MIRASIQIENGDVIDTYDGYKLIYLSSDNRTEAPIKKRDTTSYAEQAGANTDPRAVQDEFDYKVIFIIDGQDNDRDRVSAIVKDFNSKLYTQTEGSDIRTYKEVSLYNYYKHVKIVGLPSPIAEPKDFKRSKNNYEYAQVEFTIHVSDPTKCDFNLKTPEP